MLILQFNCIHISTQEQLDMYHTQKNQSSFSSAAEQGDEVRWYMMCHKAREMFHVASSSAEERIAVSARATLS